MIGNLVRPVRSGSGARERVGSRPVRVLDRVLSAVLASSPLCNPAEPRSSPATRATQEPAERAKQPPKQAAAAAAAQPQEKPSSSRSNQPAPSTLLSTFLPRPGGANICNLEPGAAPWSSGAYSLAAKSASSLKNISCPRRGGSNRRSALQGVVVDQCLCFQRCLATALCSQEPFLKTHSFLACCC